MRAPLLRWARQPQGRLTGRVAIGVHERSLGGCGSNPRLLRAGHRLCPSALETSPSAMDSVGQRRLRLSRLFRAPVQLPKVRLSCHFEERPMPAARTGASRPSTAAPRDATRLLADDHREVHALFASYRKLAECGARADDRGPLAEEICTLLTVHAALEEES